MPPVLRNTQLKETVRRHLRLRRKCRFAEAKQV